MPGHLNGIMHGILYAEGEDAEGPYTDPELLKRTLEIIQMIDPDAEIISRECNPWSEQILAGLLPYRIHVDLVDGMPQLPADVRITWPPAHIEGIQFGDLECREYMVWAENERAALRKLATLNKMVPGCPKTRAISELV